MVNTQKTDNKKDMKETKIPWTKIDKRILIFFSIWFIFAIFISIIVAFTVGISGFMEVVSVFIVFTIGAFTITGFLAYYYYRKIYIISTKRALKWFLKFALVFGFAFAIIMQILLTQTTILDEEPVQGPGGQMMCMFLALIFAGFIAVFVLFIGFFFFGFGLFGVLAIFIRRKTPDFLVEISKITSNITDSAKKKDKKKYRGYKWLAWVFNIPDVLDSETLTIREVNYRRTFPWKALKIALFWQFFFGIVIVIYISFSPFLWDFADMRDLFSNSSVGAAFIPIIIIPWFIYRRLNAKIKGPVKDFHVFEGLSSRMFQTIVAFGTIVLLIRTALKNPAIQQVMYSFVIYFIFFFAGIFIMTFVYFNYFEDDLAQDVFHRYNKLKEKGKNK
jgi:hypothetical protein